MDLLKKKKELINLLKAYLDNNLDAIQLNNFVWEVIDYFTTTPKELLPPQQDFEKDFWYAIWQIQHLADKEHENEKLTKKEFKKILDILLHKEVLLSKYYGNRP